MPGTRVPGQDAPPPGPPSFPQLFPPWRGARGGGGTSCLSRGPTGSHFRSVSLLGFPAAPSLHACASPGVTRGLPLQSVLSRPRVVTGAGNHPQLTCGLCSDTYCWTFFCDTFRASVPHFLSEIHVRLIVFKSQFSSVWCTPSAPIPHSVSPAAASEGVACFPL